MNNGTKLNEPVIMNCVFRHMLIRMQKELRSQNAERRRQAIQARKHDQLQRRLHTQGRATLTAA